MIAAVRPRSLDEAVRHLQEDPALVPTAGCTDLMVRGPEALHRMDRVIDLLGVPELRGIREVEEGIEIGATTSFSEIRRSAPVRAAFPILAQAAAVVGGWQIQNRATLGGNMANASPAGDSLPVLLALDAVVVAAGPEGLREIPYSEFHTGYRQTALRPGEIVARVRLPYLPSSAVQAFRKVGTREAQAISKVVVALAGRIEERRIADLRLAAGSVAAVPVRLRAAEEAVRERNLGPETADLAGREAAREVTPIDDVRSTADYRRFALERVVRRMVMEIPE
ncbi:MAG TPA: xanthine dehydrogenase family protein subunit M [Thermoanaerobaculia bacterium]|nr:xanthine dehydrogenase family protein subunit M [Thermoanaerobaculia bacterium]